MNKQTVIVMVLAFTLLIATPHIQLGGKEEIEKNIEPSDNDGPTEDMKYNFQVTAEYF